MFGGLGGLGDIAGLMKMAKDFQGNMKSIQKEVGEQEFSGSSGNGAVQVTISGVMEVKKVAIKPEAVDSQDVELLEDLVLSATNNALAEAKTALKEKLGDLTGGLGIDLPF